MFPAVRLNIEPACSVSPATYSDQSRQYLAYRTASCALPELAPVLSVYLLTPGVIHTIVSRAPDRHHINISLHTVLRPLRSLSDTVQNPPGTTPPEPFQPSGSLLSLHEELYVRLAQSELRHPHPRSYLSIHWPRRPWLVIAVISAFFRPPVWLDYCRHIPSDCHGLQTEEVDCLDCCRDQRRTTFTVTAVSRASEVCSTAQQQRSKAGR